MKTKVFVLVISLSLLLSGMMVAARCEEVDEKKGFYESIEENNIETVISENTTQVNPIEIYDWHDLDKIRDNPDGNYVLMNDLKRETPGYVEYNTQTEDYVSEEEAGPKYVDPWSKGDTIDIIFDEEHYDSILSVENKEGEAINHTVGEENITIDEDTEERYLYVTYENAVVGWDPIGDFNRGEYEQSNHKFTGTFDGNGHRISDLYINRPKTKNVGVFGYIDNAEVIKIGLVDINVTGNLSVGGLIGQNWDSKIVNSYSTGKVSGYQFVGGLVGDNYGGKKTAMIENSYSTCDVTGRHTGGLVGRNDDTLNNSAIVNNSYATGNVSGKTKVGVEGGLVGLNEGLIKNSYATGTVSGKDMIGGLVGRNSRTREIAMIENSYAKGDVNGEGLIGGLAGQNDGIVNNSYATGDVSGNRHVGGLIGQNLNGWVNNSYATGNVTGVRYLGALIGRNAGTVNNSYATGEVSKKDTPGFTSTLLVLSAITAIAIYRKKR